MYELKNGILYKDGKATMCLGLSYYPSYHPLKFPVKPEEDRVGGLKQDIRDMAEAGFNLVRFAALGDLKRVGSGPEGIEASFPLIDECMKATEEADIAAQVRLQGYTLNVSGHTGEAMVTPNGRELGMYECFLRASLNHEGIVQDTADCTAASAKHFMAFPSLVSYQIFNEPAYHYGVDYNPHSIAAYRKWLVAKGIKTEAEAAAVEPPRKRPQMSLDAKGEGVNSVAAYRKWQEGQKNAENPETDIYAEWMNWRLFHYERLNQYLVEMDQVARKVNPNAENMTCHMPCPLTDDTMMLGEDYYRTAEGMEILAITHYIPSFGEQFYEATQVLDATESAAALYGKHAWLLEYNARTNMSGNEWDRETYAAIGAGIKGIMYYQWRADYPFPDGPEPDEFGILFNDRSKTAAYHHAVKMNKLINEKLSEKIALAEKIRAGVAVIYSEKANALCDALEGTNRRIALGMKYAYRDLRKAGVPVDFVRACDLKENLLGVKLAVLPAAVKYYPQEEIEMLDAFVKAGGLLLECMESGGFAPVSLDGSNMRLMEVPNGEGGYHYGMYPVKSRGLHGYLQEHLLACEALERAGIQPVFSVCAPRLDVRMLKGEGYQLACLTNIDTQERPVPAGKVLELCCGCEKAKKVTFYTPDEEAELAFCAEDDKLLITLPEVKQGAFILIDC